MIDWIFLSLLICVGLVGAALALYPLRAYPKTMIATAPLIILLLGTAYVYWGGYHQRQGHLLELKKQQQVANILKTVDGTDELVARLRQQVESHPEHAKGWYLLGRLYSSQGNWQAANGAFKKAYQRSPEDMPVLINYAQSQLQLNHRKFNAEIRSLFKKALQLNPNQPDALAMLAMDAFMNKQYSQAIQQWQQLLQLMPPASDDAKAVRKAIARAQEKLNVQ